MKVPRAAINAFIACWLAVLALDGFRSCAPDVHAKLNYLLVKTGLWQGPWQLFGPEVDRQNLRLQAKLQFADGAIATWDSPEWTETSAWTQFVHARKTNYFSNILKAGEEPAWEGLCAYLARTVPHPAGATGVPVKIVVLFLRGAVIPEPGDPLIDASPYEKYDEPSPIYQWRAP